jgi:hypothetical protein
MDKTKESERKNKQIEDDCQKLIGFLLETFPHPCDLNAKIQAIATDGGTYATYEAALTAIRALLDNDYKPSSVVDAASLLKELEELTDKAGWHAFQSSFNQLLAQLRGIEQLPLLEKLNDVFLKAITNEEVKALIRPEVAKPGYSYEVSMQYINDTLIRDSTWDPYKEKAKLKANRTQELKDKLHQRIDTLCAKCGRGGHKAFNCMSKSCKDCGESLSKEYHECAKRPEGGEKKKVKRTDLNKTPRGRKVQLEIKSELAGGGTKNKGDKNKKRTRDDADFTDPLDAIHKMRADLSLLMQSSGVSSSHASANSALASNSTKGASDGRPQS